MDPAHILFAAFAFLAGVVLSCQVGMNTQLRESAGSPLWATAISFVVGLIALLACCAAARAPLPSWAGLARAPWWAWLGGAMGAAYVAATVVLAPRLGAAALVGLVVAGQVLSSLVLDHFGALGFAVHTMNLPRIAGAALLLTGMWLILRY
jgi:bacterial/archaeal transporter family-2 protein